jgi:hypothetical protein
MNGFSIFESRFSIGGFAADSKRASSGLGPVALFEQPENPKSKIQNRKS